MNTMLLLRLIILLLILLVIPYSLLWIISFCKIYKKMGQKWWSCLIPVYSTYVLNTKVQKRNPAWILITVVYYGILISRIIYKVEMDSEIYKWIILLSYLIFLVYFIVLTNGISKGFKRGKWFTTGLVLFPVVFYPVLGFSKDKFYEEIFEKNKVKVENKDN